MERLLGTLREYDLSLQGLVINRVIENFDSPSLETLSRAQQQHVVDLKRMAGSLPVATLPYSLKEIKGRKALSEAGELVCGQLELY